MSAMSTMPKISAFADAFTADIARSAMRASNSRELEPIPLFSCSIISVSIRLRIFLQAVESEPAIGCETGDARHVAYTARAVIAFQNDHEVDCVGDELSLWRDVGTLC